MTASDLLRPYSEPSRRRPVAVCEETCPGCPECWPAVDRAADFDALEILSRAKTAALTEAVKRAEDWPDGGPVYEVLEAWRTAANAWDRILRGLYDGLPWRG